MERWARSPTKTGRRYEASASVFTGIRRFEAPEFSPAAPTQYQPNSLIFYYLFFIVNLWLKIVKSFVPKKFTFIIKKIYYI